MAETGVTLFVQCCQLCQKYPVLKLTLRVSALVFSRQLKQGGSKELATAIARAGEDGERQTSSPARACVLLIRPLLCRLDGSVGEVLRWQLQRTLVFQCTPPQQLCEGEQLVPVPLTSSLPPFHSQLNSDRTSCQTTADSVAPAPRAAPPAVLRPPGREPGPLDTGHSEPSRWAFQNPNKESEHFSVVLIKFCSPFAKC